MQDGQFRAKLEQTRHMAKLASWRFFVDESGQFGDPAEDVAVAGLLIRDEPGRVTHELERGLRRAFPDLAWPLHAAVYDRPVGLALQAYIQGDEDPSAGSI